MKTGIGLDIGTQTVKLVELVKEGSDLVLNKAAIKAIPYSAKMGPEERTRAAAEAITQLLDEQKIKLGPIGLAVSGLSAFIRFIKILPVARKKLEQTILYEAQQQIPFPLDEVVWDYHLFDQDSGAPGETEAILVAIKRDILEKELDTARKAKLSSNPLDTDPLALYNCVKFNRDYREGAVTMIVDIGTDATNLVIFKGNGLWLRSCPIAGHKFTESIQNHLGLSFEEAEKFKKDDKADEGKLQEAINPVLEEMVEEIKRSIDFYHFQKSEAKPFQIDQLLLSGGGANLKGLDKFFKDKLGIKVETVNPLKGLNREKIKINARDRASYSIAIGLALRQLGRGEVKIDLLRQIRRKEKEASQKMVYTFGTLALVLILLLTAFIFMRRDYNLKLSQLERIEGLTETGRIYQPQVKALRRERGILKRKLALLYNRTQERGLWLDVLKELERLLPMGAWITDFSASLPLEKGEHGVLNLTGKALSYQGVNDFVSELKLSPLFTNVKPLASSFVKDGEGDKEEIVEFIVSTDVIRGEIGDLSP